MFVFFENDTHITIDKFNELLQYGINNILTIIKNKFEKNGYKINFFTNIYSSNIKILDCDFLFKLKTSKKIKLSKLDCLSNIFEKQTNSKMIYKRVKKL